MCTHAPVTGSHYYLLHVLLRCSIRQPPCNISCWSDASSTLVCSEGSTCEQSLTHRCKGLATLTHLSSFIHGIHPSICSFIHSSQPHLANPWERIRRPDPVFQLLIGRFGCLQGAASPCSTAGEDEGDISQEGVTTSTSSHAESPSLPPLSMTQQALVGAGLLAYGGLFAATATVMAGAAAVKMLPRPTIPRPRLPSFSMW